MKYLNTASGHLNSTHVQFVFCGANERVSDFSSVCPSVCVSLCLSVCMVTLCAGCSGVDSVNTTAWKPAADSQTCTQGSCTLIPRKRNGGMEAELGRFKLPRARPGSLPKRQRGG